MIDDWWSSPWGTTHPKKELRGSPVLVCTPGFPLRWPPVFGFLSYVLASPRRKKWQVTRRSYSVSVPIGSMYAIYGNIYHQYTPNVSIYTIHGSYGVWQQESRPGWLRHHHTCLCSLPSTVPVHVEPNCRGSPMQALVIGDVPWGDRPIYGGFLSHRGYPQIIQVIRPFSFKTYIGV